MTRNQAIRRHRMMWRWLSENPEMEKRNWPGWKKNGGKYSSAVGGCFLCAAPPDGPCCILVWPKVPDDCLKSIYREWSDLGICIGDDLKTYTEDDLKRRAALAKQISELPVRRIK